MPVPKAAAIAAITVAVCATSACATDYSSGTDDGPRQVTVIGTGQVEGVPDTLIADIGVEFTAPDVTAAMDQTNQRQQAVIGAVADAGVDHQDINTTDVTVQPQYGGSTETVNGYRARNSIRVAIRKLESASHVLAAAVNSGGDAARIDSVRYSIEDDSKLVKDARARAFDDARNRAEQYAQLAGLDLGTVISIWETSGSTPPVNPAPRSPMATDVPLEPGQQTVSFSVTAVWELS